MGNESNRVWAFGHLAGACVHLWLVFTPSSLNPACYPLIPHPRACPVLDAGCESGLRHSFKACWLITVEHAWDHPEHTEPVWTLLSFIISNQGAGGTDKGQDGWEERPHPQSPLTRSQIPCILSIWGMNKCGECWVSNVLCLQLCGLGSHPNLEPLF